MLFFIILLQVTGYYMNFPPTINKIALWMTSVFFFLIIFLTMKTVWFVVIQPELVFGWVKTVYSWHKIRGFWCWNEWWNIYYYHYKKSNWTTYLLCQMLVLTIWFYWIYSINNGQVMKWKSLELTKIHNVENIGGFWEKKSSVQ